MGLDYYPLVYKLSDGSIINVHINDTCGQEIYNSLWDKYYKIADGILLVYDIANKISFDKIKNFYIQKIKENCKYGIPIILLGNKTDLKENREVTQQEAIDLSINEEFIFKESSCKNNENVADAFETIMEMWNINSKKNTQDSDNAPETRCKPRGGFRKVEAAWQVNQQRRKRYSHTCADDFQKQGTQRAACG